MPGLNTNWAGHALDLITGRAVALEAPRDTYLALLVADAGEDVTDLTTMAEVTTAGYARQQVVWTEPTTESPVTVMNASLLFFGPFTEDMTSPAAYAALVTTPSGTEGEILYVWDIANPLTAVTNESLQIAAGALTLSI